MKHQLRPFIIALFVMLAIFLIYALQSHAQDTVRIHHKDYTTAFIKSGNIPVCVHYKLTKEMLSCAQEDKTPRAATFKVDPLLPGEINVSRDYKNSGYDQGHNMSAQDNACDYTEEQECFYFTNIYPQTPQLNRKIWLRLEEHERQLAKAEDSIYVYIGFYQISGTIGPDKILVPKWCWKAIYVPEIDAWGYYSYPNTRDYDFSSDNNYQDYAAPQEQIPWIKYVISKWGR